MEARYLERKNIDIAAWDALVGASPQGSIFCLSWYIDAVADNDWSGIMVYEGDVLQTVFPLMVREKYTLKYALQPVLAKYWGACFANLSFKNTYEEFSWKRSVIDEILKLIPALCLIKYNLHPAMDYALPFQNHGFTLKARYSFSLAIDLPFEIIENGFARQLRRNLQKATQNDFEILPDQDFEQVFPIFKNNENAGRQMGDNKFFPAFKRVCEAGKSHDSFFGLSAKNNKGETVAYCAFLRDNHTTYALLNVVEPALRDSGAASLVMKEGIRHAQTSTTRFDFTGGALNEQFERFFRSFGARPLPYLSIEKVKFPFSLFLK